MTATGYMPGNRQPDSNFHSLAPLDDGSLALRTKHRRLLRCCT